jgi:processive 1,2-diacylglycerol beta-glucosyltransferase
VRVEDTLDDGSRVFRRAYTQAYLDLTAYAPGLWRLFYEGTNLRDPEWVEITNRTRSLVERLAGTHLLQLVKGFAPAAIVCTHFLPVELLLRLKRRGQLQQPIYCVVTDFVAHCFWAMPGIDGYFVASQLTRDQLSMRGVAPAIIHISGIPVDLAIAEPKPRDAMRLRHGLAVDRPLISLFGGGLDGERVRLALLRRCAQDIGRPRAALDIAKAILCELRAGLVGRAGTCA